jgi:hypothetical protein
VIRLGNRPLDVLAHALGDQRTAGRRVLAVDQFEEVFTACSDDAERAAFLGAITQAASASDGTSTIVIAMRADFYGRVPGTEPLHRCSRRLRSSRPPGTVEDLRFAGWLAPGGLDGVGRRRVLRALGHRRAADRQDAAVLVLAAQANSIRSTRIGPQVPRMPAQTAQGTNPDLRANSHTSVSCPRRTYECQHRLRASSHSAVGCRRPKYGCQPGGTTPAERP